jgi:Flp pilus assembly protein TadG
MDTVSKLMKIIRDRKGIAAVYIALILFAMVAFVGLAIDIGYMYVAKGQLQNAADAAALAGASLLIEKSQSTNQPAARNAAWKFACENKVLPGGSNVFLISAAENCSSPPGDLNNTNNNPDGDIVLGHWDSATGFLPQVGTPLPSGASINAVKVVARRTSENADSNVKIGNNPISLFFASVVGWSEMSASAQAIAIRNKPPTLNIPLCASNCGTLNTSLNIVSPNVTRGTRFFLKPAHGTPLIGWTTFDDANTSKENIESYLKGEKNPPDMCGGTPMCLNTTNGVVNPVLCTLKGMLEDENNVGDYVVNGVTVRGMKIMIPMLNDLNNTCAHKGLACISDPAYQPGDAFPFYKFAEAIITDSIPEGSCPKVTGPLTGGNPGLVMLGTGNGPSGSSTFDCLTCSEAEGIFLKTTRLVK